MPRFAHVTLNKISNRGFIVQIVTTNSGKVKIELDALLPILEKVGDHPLSIVSINGPMRTGKSYLLGHFLRFLETKGRDEWIYDKLEKEFYWSSSVDHHTTGILVWSEPFFLDKHGRQIAVLLMDTQGSFDELTDYNINYMLFALSYLLSSTFIYNVKNNISEDALQVLSLFLGFAKMTLNEDTMSKLVVMIRDWQSPKDYKYGYYDKSSAKENNFLNDKMMVRSHMAENVKEVHTEVINSFQSVACCLLPHPGIDLATRANTDTLDEDFITTLEEIIPKVCAAENILHQTKDGQEITGTLMAEKVKEWGELFDKISFDDIKSYVNMAAEKQNYTALSTALKAYNKQMDAAKFSGVFTTERLKIPHDNAMSDAIDIFKKQRKIKSPGVEEQFLNKLQTDIQKAYTSFQEINEALAKTAKMMAQSEVEKTHLELKKTKACVEDLEIMIKKEREEREKLHTMYKEEMEKIQKMYKEEMKKMMMEPRMEMQQLEGKYKELENLEKKNTVGLDEEYGEKMEKMEKEETAKSISDNKQEKRDMLEKILTDMEERLNEMMKRNRERRYREVMNKTKNEHGNLMDNMGEKNREQVWGNNKTEGKNLEAQHGEILNLVESIREDIRRCHFNELEKMNKKHERYVEEIRRNYEKNIESLNGMDYSVAKYKMVNEQQSRGSKASIEEKNHAGGVVSNALSYLSEKMNPNHKSKTVKMKSDIQKNYTENMQNMISEMNERHKEDVNKMENEYRKKMKYLEGKR